MSTSATESPISATPAKDIWCPQSLGLMGVVGYRNETADGISYVADNLMVDRTSPNTDATNERQIWGFNSWPGSRRVSVCLDENKQGGTTCDENTIVSVVERPLALATSEFVQKQRVTEIPLTLGSDCPPLTADRVNFGWSPAVMLLRDRWVYIVHRRKIIWEIYAGFDGRWRSVETDGHGSVAARSREICLRKPHQPGVLFKSSRTHQYGFFVSPFILSPEAIRLLVQYADDDDSPLVKAVISRGGRYSIAVPEPFRIAP